MSEFKYSKLNKTENGFEVIDTRINKVIARNLKGSKAIARQAFHEQEVIKANKFWSK